MRLQYSVSALTVFTYCFLYTVSVCLVHKKICSYTCIFAYLDVRPAEEHEYDVGMVLLDSYDEGCVAVAVADVGICLG